MLEVLVGMSHEPAIFASVVLLRLGVNFRSSLPGSRVRSHFPLALLLHGKVQEWSFRIICYSVGGASDPPYISFGYLSSRRIVLWDLWFKIMRRQMRILNQLLSAENYKRYTS